jgi:prepilin-type processing-associated H-X9-DG protein
MNDINTSTSENKSERLSNKLAYSRLFVALSLLMVGFVLVLACKFYISESQTVILGVIPYNFAIYLFPFYFLGIALRKVWSFYMAFIAFVCWAVLFLFLAVFIQHYLFFFDGGYRVVSFIDFEMDCLKLSWLWALSVIVLFLGLIGSGQLLEQKYGRKIFSKEKKEGKRKLLSLPELLVVVAIVAFMMGLLLPALSRVKNPSYQMKCGTNLCVLGIAMRLYSEQFERAYPPADKWCDMLIKYCEVSSEQFKCPSDKKSNCSYAFNSFCEPNSPPDMVLLFESIGGWNGHGGQELIQLRHQRRKGCNILFNDGHCAFVETKDIPNLNWK